MDPITVKHYNAEKVFKLSRTETRSMYGYDLAKGFYNARYNDDGTLSSTERSDSWGANAGACQFFYKKTKKPVDWSIDGVKKGVFYDVSLTIPTKEEGYGSTSYGHSERICMRDLLDAYMDYKEIDPHDIKKPSHSDNTRGGNNQYDILKNLTNDASSYKYFLAGSGMIVKFWSERKPCDYKTVRGEQVEGAKCEDFIKAICPQGSHYGYTTLVSQWRNAEEIRTLVQKQSKNLKEAYKKDILFSTASTELEKEDSKCLEEEYKTCTNDVNNENKIIRQALLHKHNNISAPIDEFVQTFQDTNFFSTQLSGETADNDV